MSVKTLYDKLWDDHVVQTEGDGSALIYIDRQLIHEVTSPQAFENLRLTGRQPRYTARNLAVADHNVPTTDRSLGIADPVSRLQVETLDKNCSEFGITEFDMADPRQSIVHVTDRLLKQDFVLNNSDYQGAGILLTRENFGGVFY